jgi:hypothetical protein
MIHSIRSALGIPALVMLGSLVACGGKKPDPAPAPSPSVASTAPGATGTAAAPAAGTPAAGGPSITIAKPPKVRIDQQLITRDVIRSTQYTNLFDVIQTLRSNWIRVRAAQSIEGRSPVLQVYLDNQRLAGGLDELKTMSPVNIESVRYFDPVQASARWGLDHGAGAIYVTTAKQ